MQVDDKEAAIREAILDMTAYFAGFQLPVTESQLTNLLSVRTSHLAVKAAILRLLTEKRLKQLANASYGWPGRSYAGLESRQNHQAELLKKARTYGRWMGWLPFVKAIVVMDSVARGDVTEESNINLLIVTSPGRIFVTKGIIWKALKTLHQLDVEPDRPGGFSLRLFLTTRGVNLERDMMRINEPHLRYWLMTGVPVYGARRWYELLHQSKYMTDRLPNFMWPGGGVSIDRTGWRWLDQWDNRGYRLHLKHTSQQAGHHQVQAFVRIRPDIINLQAYDRSAEIAERWQKLRGTWEAPSLGAVRPRRPASGRARSSRKLNRKTID